MTTKVWCLVVSAHGLKLRVKGFVHSFVYITVAKKAYRMVR